MIKRKRKVPSFDCLEQLLPLDGDVIEVTPGDSMAPDPGSDPDEGSFFDWVGDVLDDLEDYFSSGPSAPNPEPVYEPDYLIENDPDFLPDNPYFYITP
jgi:hypothetical protein